MARGKKHTPEQIVTLLRQVEVAVANGRRLDRLVKSLRSQSKPTTDGARNSADCRWTRHVV